MYSKQEDKMQNLNHFLDLIPPETLNNNRDILKGFLPQSLLESLLSLSTVQYLSCWPCEPSLSLQKTKKKKKNCKGHPLSSTIQFHIEYCAVISIIFVKWINHLGFVSWIRPLPWDDEKYLLNMFIFSVRLWAYLDKWEHEQLYSVWCTVHKLQWSVQHLQV